MLQLQIGKKKRIILCHIKFLSGKDLPQGYGGQQTVSFDSSGNILPATVLISDADYMKEI